MREQFCKVVSFYSVQPDSSLPRLRWNPFQLKCNCFLYYAYIFLQMLHHYSLGCICPATIFVVINLLCSPILFIYSSLFSCHLHLIVVNLHMRVSQRDPFEALLRHFACLPAIPLCGTCFLHSSLSCYHLISFHTQYNSLIASPLFCIRTRSFLFSASVCTALGRMFLRN